MATPISIQMAGPALVRTPSSHPAGRRGQMRFLHGRLCRPCPARNSAPPVLVTAAGMCRTDGAGLVQAMAGRPGPAYQTPCTGLTPSTYRTTRRSARPATTLADEWAHRRCGCWCGRLRTGSARTWWLGPDANDCVSLGPLKPALAGLNGGTDRGIARNTVGVEGIHASL